MRLELSYPDLRHDHNTVIRDHEVDRGVTRQTFYLDVEDTYRGIKDVDMVPNLSLQNLASVDIGKDFMLKQGYIKKDFDVQKRAAAPEFLEQVARELLEGEWKKLTLPAIPAADNIKLLPGAMAIVAILLCEGLLLVRSYSQKHGYKAAGTIAVVMLFFTDLLAFLPNAALAGIVANAVLSLIEVHEFRELWRMRRSEFWIAAVCLVGVLAVGPLRAVMIAFLLSVIDLKKMQNAEMAQERLDLSFRTAVSW